MLSQAALHVVVTHYSVALLCGVVVGRRNRRTVILAASTLSVRDTREQLCTMLNAGELAAFDAGYDWRELSDHERDSPMFVPRKLAHPTIAWNQQRGLPLVIGPKTAELVGVAAPRRLYD